MGIGGWLGDRASDVKDAVDSGLESAEGLVEDGAEKVGEFVDWGTEQVADGLDYVGLEGAADAVENFGDEVASRLGAEVDEDNLGETDDPKQLIHGDVEAINELSGHLKKFGSSFTTGGKGMQGIDAGTFTGHSANAYDSIASKQPSAWFDAGDACTDAGKAWGTFATTVSWAQRQAQDAIDLWNEGETASAKATSDHNAAVNTYNAAARAYNAKVKAGEDPGVKPTAPGAFVDPGEALRARAQQKLDHARTQRNEAADTAIAAIKGALAAAPPEPPPTDQAAMNAADLKMISDIESAHFLVGIGKGVTGLVAFLRSINPTDHYNLTHPAEYFQGLSDTASGLVYAAGHPDDALKGMLDGIRDDPSEWLGTLVPDLVATAATGGAGVATKVDDIVRLGDNIADTRKAGIPDGCKSVCGDPVDVATGAVLLPQVDLDLEAPLPFRLTRHHSSSWRYGRWFGRTWASSLDEGLVVTPEHVAYVRGDGVVLMYPHTAVGSTVLPQAGQRWPMERLDHGVYRVTDPETRLAHYFVGAGAEVPLVATDPPGRGPDYLPAR